MPQRVAQGFKTIGALIGVGGGIISYLVAAPRILGLTDTLNIFNTFLLGVTLLILWLLHIDLQSMDDSTSNEAEDDGMRPDGGFTPSSELRELQEESPEGGGALAGLVAGGALGLLGGPAGVVLGGLAGGVLGNEAEYQQIVDRYREELSKAAEASLDRENVRSPRPYTVENISHRSKDDSYAVLIEDASEKLHQIRLHIDEGKYVYEEV